MNSPDEMEELGGGVRLVPRPLTPCLDTLGVTFADLRVAEESAKAGLHDPLTAGLIVAGWRAVRSRIGMHIQYVAQGNTYAGSQFSYTPAPGFSEDTAEMVHELLALVEWADLPPRTRYVSP